MLIFSHRQVRSPRAALTAFIALSLVAGSSAALAQGSGAMGPALAKFGGSMTAAARICGDLDDAKAQENRAQQKKAALEGGVNAAVFDKGFDEGQSQTEARFAALSPADKKKSCAELHQFGKNAAKAATSQK